MKDLIKGKCLIAFDEWIYKQRYSISHDVGERQMNIVHLGDMFKQLHYSMQIGVLIEFFLSVDIIIDVHPVLDYNETSYTKILYWIENVTALNMIEEDWNEDEYKTLEEAQKQSVIKANQIFNTLNKL